MKKTRHLTTKLRYILFIYCGRMLEEEGKVFLNRKKYFVFF